MPVNDLIGIDEIETGQLESLELDAETGLQLTFDGIAAALWALSTALTWNRLSSSER